ncbi:Pea pathogenicity protein [Paramyrothecium foliicola]|nr:Pea pathogenicity protein [Paramyrothecium foliicola]
MSTPTEPHSRQFSHINGSAAELLDRLAVAELCKGWPVYRDNSEWMNFRSLFTEDAVVWTSTFTYPYARIHLNRSIESLCYRRLPSLIAWSGLQPVDKFIEISKDGKAKGAFILHRENGTLVELNPTTQRALGKMKATITQRFTTAGESAESPPIVYDVDCDCRFLFFCLRDDAGAWKAQYVKLVYEKDKVCAVDGQKVPVFDEKILDKYPAGYKYLGAAQASLGHAVDPDLATLDERYWNKMYECMEAWLAGARDPGLCWMKRDE